MKIFVINLESAVSRRKRMKTGLLALELDFEFFPAIAVDSSPEFHLEFPYSKSAALEILDRKLTTGELGCVLSHLSIYRKMVRENIPEALILEDDAECDRQLPEILRYLTRLQDWEMVLLGHRSLNRNSMIYGAEMAYLGRYEILGRSIGNAAEFPLGSYAYVLKSTAAVKLLGHFCPIRMPADFVTGGAEMAKVRLRLIAPPVVTPRAVGSTIGPRAYGNKSTTEFQMVKMIKQLLRKSLLLTRKIGILRKSYIWVFNQKFR